MTFRRRLLLGFSAIVLVTLVTGTIAVTTLHTSMSAKDALAARTLHDIALAERVRFLAERLVASSRGYLLTLEEDHLRRYEEARVAFVGQLAQLRRDVPTYAPQEIEAEAAGRFFVIATHTAQKLRRASDDPRQLLPFFDQVVQPARLALDGAIERLVGAERAHVSAVQTEARRVTTHAGILLTIGVLLAVASSVALALIVSRRLSRTFAREQEAVRLARQAADARDDILAVVSHDLRNPLGAILLEAHLLTRQASLPDKSRARAGAIHGAATRMRRLIEDVLDVARIQGRAFVIQRDRCQVASLLDEASQMFRAHAEEKGIELTTRAAATASVWADRERALQVLANLLGNALKFTPDGGTVSLDACIDGRDVRFAIRDDGPGIEPDAIPHLFERHWQANPTGRGGLGLGLYIAKHIVDLHGGRIWATSRPGHGSVFYFTLPALPSRDEQPDVGVSLH